MIDDGVELFHTGVVFSRTCKGARNYQICSYKVLMRMEGVIYYEGEGPFVEGKGTFDEGKGALINFNKGIYQS